MKNSITDTGYSDSFKDTEHPYPNTKEDETYGEYYDRVHKMKQEGFNLARLSWGDWRSYCIGFGSDPETSKDELIN